MLRERNMRAVGGGTEYRIRRVQPVAAGAADVPFDSPNTIFY